MSPRAASPSPHHHHPTSQASAHGHGHAAMLDLDARVVGHLEELTSWVGGHLRSEPSRVLDIGSGSGTGTLALARRFPRSTIIALDQSPEMISHLTDAAARAGVGDRVHPVQANADERWPDIGTFDLVWASSSLHHVEHPDSVLRTAHSTLSSGGIMTVIEMDGLPRFLPEDIGFGRPGLERRCHEAMRRAGWNAHPDWGPHLQHAGFELVAERTFTYQRDPAPADAALYARQVFTNIRGRLTQLEPQDLDAIDRLLDDDASGSLSARDDLVVRSERTVWVGRRE
ncbi:class I SAM-dependent methyltransferase [Microbacterium sp. NPDC058342]|uniref:class I SAM-dependent methyltransferase n=1 Tax=Microbacterium sp. NPDC058342 TaxID=3346454 RepID=UPI0036540567